MPGRNRQLSENFLTIVCRIFKLCFVPFFGMGGGGYCVCCRYYCCCVCNMCFRECFCVFVNVWVYLAFVYRRFWCMHKSKVPKQRGRSQYYSWGDGRHFLHWWSVKWKMAKWGSLRDIREENGLFSPYYLLLKLSSILLFQNGDSGQFIVVGNNNSLSSYHQETLSIHFVLAGKKLLTSFRLSSPQNILFDTKFHVAYPWHWHWGFQTLS